MLIKRKFISPHFQNISLKLQILFDDVSRRVYHKFEYDFLFNAERYDTILYLLKCMFIGRKLLYT